MPKPGSYSRQAIKLRLRVTCPHCWHVFAPQHALWISQHPDLIGDARLGADHQQRFLPTRFTVDGAALDARGFACHDLACPNCHLAVPRAMLEMKPVFLSILGAPASGKSYFLASMTWRLRQLLPKHFALNFGDADPMSNQRLQEYEALQFLNSNPDALVAIEKTQTYGDLYDTVLFGDQAMNFPRPFLFALTGMEQHPNFAVPRRLSRVVCLYDNAGESFLPGQDAATSPVTRHLALSQALLFLFDPTQDMRFRQACHGQTDDPQMKQRSERLERERPVRQETILLEAAQRVRRYAGLAQSAKHHRPLVVVVTKYDCWSSLLNRDPLAPPWVGGAKQSISALRSNVVEQMSQRIRALLWQLTPELVAAAEGFAENVIYIPVSATGRGPETDPVSGAFGIRPRDIAPQWVEVPMLYVLGRWMSGIIPLYDQAASRRQAMLPPPTGGPANAPPGLPPASTASGAPATLSGEFTIAPPQPGRGPAMFEGEQPLPQRRREL